MPNIAQCDEDELIVVSSILFERGGDYSNETGLAGIVLNLAGETKRNFGKYYRCIVDGMRGREVFGWISIITYEI